MSSEPGRQHGEVELRVSLPGGIRVHVTAPPESSSAAAALLGHISLFEFSGGTGSEHSFEVVSSAPPSERASVPTRRLETRDQIARSFPVCPERFFRQSALLSGSSVSGRQRIERAWTAGNWAAAVRDSRVGSPNRTPQLELRSRFYAVLRAPGLEQPTIFRSSAGFWGCVQRLEDGEAISQSFPSELEAKIYFEAAGVVDFAFAP